MVHPQCLQFLNAALNRYALDARVYHVNAYRYPMPPTQLPYFSRLPSSWGWATWQRAWTNFEAGADQLAQRVLATGRARNMDFDGSFPYFQMLRNQARGNLDSWAIRWYAAALLADGLALCPSASQVTNTGLDNSGEHCGVSSDYDVAMGPSSEEWPAEVAEDADNIRQMRDFFRGIRPTLTRRILHRVKRTMLAGRGGGNV
jgi:hypothetical protein